MTDLMTAPKETPDLTNLSYPCFIQPIYPRVKIMYVPSVGASNASGDLYEAQGSLFKLEALESISGVLEGYLLPDPYKLIATDYLTFEEFSNKQCKRPYIQRLQQLREVVMDLIADPSQVIDIPTHEVENPSQIKKLYKDYLTENMRGVSIRSIEGHYIFGESKNDELLELT